MLSYAVNGNPPRSWTGMLTVSIPLKATRSTPPAQAACRLVGSPKARSNTRGDNAHADAEPDSELIRAC